MEKLLILERLKKHPLVSWLLSTLAVLTFSITWTMKISSEKIELIKIKHEAIVAELNLKLSSIPRDREKNDYFDISNMFSSKSSISMINQDCAYFSEDNFYAPKETSYLKYTKYTQAEFDKKFYPDEEMEDEFKDINVNFWAPTEIKLFKGLKEIKIASPTIAVRRMKVEQLKAFSEHLAINYEVNKSIRNILRKKKLIETKEEAEYLSQIMRKTVNVYYNNIDLALIDSYINSTLYNQLENENVTFQLQNLLKIKNVIYLQGLTEIKNVEIDDKIYPRYYVRNELYLTSNNREIITISLNIPSEGPMIVSEIYNDISRWLKKFVIIVD